MTSSTAATLVVKGAGNTIGGGTFDKVGVQVGWAPTVGTPNPPTAALTIGGSISIKDANISTANGPADNELYWLSGSIATTGSAQVQNNGVMRISSPGTLGNASDTTKDVLVNNSGTLSVFSTPTISGNFVNRASFIVRENANVKINGTAKQTRGTTELRGGTTTMTTSTGVYAVDAGSLIGNGTSTAT